MILAYLESPLHELCQMDFREFSVGDDVPGTDEDHVSKITTVARLIVTFGLACSLQRGRGVPLYSRGEFLGRQAWNAAHGAGLWGDDLSLRSHSSREMRGQRQRIGRNGFYLQRVCQGTTQTALGMW